LNRLTGIWIISLLLLIAFSCGPPPAVISPPERIPPLKEKPAVSIRVGLLKNIDSVEFSADAGFIITNQEETFKSPERADERWCAKVIESAPGQSAYRLILAVAQERSAARRKADAFSRAGYPTEISPVGLNPRFTIQGLNNQREYRIYLKRIFSTWDEARAYQKELWPGKDTRIVHTIVSQSSGRIRLIHLGTGKNYESTSALILTGADIRFYEVPVGTGFHWEHSENRTYAGKIEFTLDLNGKLAVVNELPLEKYVEGVLPSEMASGFPMEALKAQAVAARSKAMANWGIVHSADPFDVCADVHCQVYSGISMESPQTKAAVRATAGMFMMKNDRICDAVFGACCGGHTESFENAWAGEPVDYLRSHIDGPSWLRRFGSLEEEENVKNWIDSSPNAYCNTQDISVPDALKYTQKYYRWQAELSQNELRQSLEKYLQRSLGEITDLIPLKRGLSGRIIRLKVIGTAGTAYIDQELNIRKALSQTTLWSACFYCEETGWGVPEKFIFKGAGFGHGVGMCQTGAAMMAIKGSKFNLILKHYYVGIKIKKLY
jgi:stage II sporulation protein D